MVKKFNSNAARIKRHRRVRAKISGTAATPRLNVFRSNTNIYAQIIDDVQGVTLVSASSLDKEIEGGGNKAAARQVGLAPRRKSEGEGNYRSGLRPRRLPVPRQSKRTCGRRPRGRTFVLKEDEQ